METATVRNIEPESDRSVVIERTFDAPARLLFKAYTKPEHVMRWFGPPGYPLTHCEMDFRKGGAFRFQMTGPDHQGGPLFGGTYLDIVPNQRIQYDNGFFEDMGPANGRMIVTITFDEIVKDKQTKVVIHTLFDSIAMRNAHVGMGYVEGVSSTLPAFVETALGIERAHVVQRLVDAPARLLFEAYSKKEHLLRWFGPPKCPVTSCDIDFHVGGRYRMSMTTADGAAGPTFGGAFREIIPNKKIVYDNNFERAGAETMVVTTWFDEREDGKTLLTISTVFGSNAMMQEHMEAGFESGSSIAADQLIALAGELANKERA